MGDKETLARLARVLREAANAEELKFFGTSDRFEDDMSDEEETDEAGRLAKEIMLKYKMIPSMAKSKEEAAEMAKQVYDIHVSENHHQHQSLPNLAQKVTHSRFMKAPVGKILTPKRMQSTEIHNLREGFKGKVTPNLQPIPPPRSFPPSTLQGGSEAAEVELPPPPPTPKDKISGMENIVPSPPSPQVESVIPPPPPQRSDTADSRVGSRQRDVIHHKQNSQEPQKVGIVINIKRSDDVDKHKSKPPIAKPSSPPKPENQNWLDTASNILVQTVKIIGAIMGPVVAAFIEIMWALLFDTKAPPTQHRVAARRRQQQHTSGLPTDSPWFNQHNTQRRQSPLRMSHVTASPPGMVNQSRMTSPMRQRLRM